MKGRKGRHQKFKKMKKLLLASGVSVFGLLTAKICFGAESLITWSASNTTELVGWVGQVWTDLYVPLLFALGISIGFIIFRKVIGLVKSGAR